MYTQEKLINPGNGFDPRIIDVADALVFETTRGSYVYEIAKIREPVVAGKYKFLGGLIRVVEDTIHDPDPALENVVRDGAQIQQFYLMLRNPAMKSGDDVRFSPIRAITYPSICWLEAGTIERVALCAQPTYPPAS
jgi:hypothetical protein